MKSNLLVTFDPNHFEVGKREIENFLKEVGEKGKILKADKGLAELKVKDPRKVITKLKKIPIKRFTYTQHWIPVDFWLENKITTLKKKISKLGKEIGKQEKWKMDLNIRRLKKKPNERKLVLSLTELVKKENVDLKNPKKIIKVEIIGKKVALSLLKPNEILNISKLKNKN